MPPISHISSTRKANQTPTNKTKQHTGKGHKTPTTMNKSQTSLEGVQDWEMAPTPPVTDHEQSPPRQKHNVGLSMLVNDNMVQNTPPQMPRYRHVIPDKMHETTKHLFTPSKSPSSSSLFRDSKTLLEKLEETELYDPLSKIEKLRRRLSLLKSQIKQSSQLLSEGNNLLSPSKNRSITPKMQSTPPRISTNTFHSNYDHFGIQKTNDDTFLLERERIDSTPSKTHKLSTYNPHDDSICDTIPSTPSRKMSALTLTGKKSPSSTTRLSTPPTATFSNTKSPSSLTKKKIDEPTSAFISTPKTPRQVTSPKNILQNTITPKTSRTKASTPHSSKRKSPPQTTTSFSYDEIFTPTPKKMKKTNNLADESFSLDLFKTPTPVKPKHPTSIKINGLMRKSLSMGEGENPSRNIFEEEDDEFVFKERKKIQTKR